jgi:probable blue pigment (indigoidine) exporter
MDAEHPARERINRRSRRSAAAIVTGYATLCLIWSTTWLAIKVGLRGMPPLIGAGLRFLIAGMVFGIIRLVRREGWRVERVHRSFVGLTAVTVFALPYGLVYVGESRVASGVAAVLFATLPLYSALIAARLLPDEPITPAKLGGILIGIAGVAVVVRGSLSVGGGFAAMAATFGLLVAPASGAFGQAMGRLHRGDVPRTLLLAWSMGLGGASLLAVGLVTEPAHIRLDGATLGALLYLSLAGSVVGFAILYWLLGRIGAVSVALLFLVLPVFAPLIGWAFQGEALTLSLGVGSAIVVAGLAVATLDPARRKARSRGRASGPPGRGAPSEDNWAQVARSHRAHRPQVGGQR